MEKIIHGKLYNLATAKEIAYVTNDDYCLSPEHVSIDENGECNLMVLFPPEEEEETNGF